MKIKFMQALLGLMFMTPVAANAAGGDDMTEDILVLKMADETTAEFKLADKPVIEFAEGKFKVTSESATTDFDQAAVTEFHFEKKSTETGINAAAGNVFSFTYNDNANVIVSGSKAKRATVLSIDGKMIKSQAVVGGNVSVNISDCKPGIYVLNLEKEHTFKIVKK